MTRKQASLRGSEATAAISFPRAPHASRARAFCSVPFFFQGSQEVFILDKSGWYSVIFLGVFCSAIAYVFWYDALKKLPASEVGAFLYLNPIVAVAVATFFLDEPISFSTLVGGGLVLIGVGIVDYREES